MNQVRDEMFKKQREYEAYQAKVDRVQRELVNKGMTNSHSTHVSVPPLLETRGAQAS